MANIKIEKKNEFRIEYTKGDTFALKLTFKNITQDLTSAIFTVKENYEDTTPLIEKTINAGISKIEENLYKNEIVYKLQLQANDSEFLEADHLYLYDLKIAVGNVIKTVIKGNFIVTYNVTGVDRITTELAEIEIDDTIETDAETTPATHGIEYETDPVATEKIGDMSTLSTTAKDTLVNAINEITPKANSALEEITKIENGTVTVPSANEAEIAQYASADTTKGTIEERLTDISETMPKLKTATFTTLDDFYNFALSKITTIISVSISFSSQINVNLKTYNAKTSTFSDYDTEFVFGITNNISKSSASSLKFYYSDSYSYVFSINNVYCYVSSNGVSEIDSDYDKATIFRGVKQIPRDTAGNFTVTYYE